jgi:hypothetical protein
MEQRALKILTIQQRIFAFSLIIEGTTEKVLQNIMPLKSNYNKTLVSLNKKIIFEPYREKIY